MSHSALGSVLADVVTQLKAITPTVNPDQRWRYLGRTRDGEGKGSTDRAYSIRDEPGGPVPIVGCGQRQEKRALLLRTYYLLGQDLEDRKSADHQDLISALQPRSTYPSGAWGELRVRKVGEPQDDDSTAGRLVVIHRVEVIYRFPVLV